MSRNHVKYRAIIANKRNIVNNKIPEQLIVRVGKACNFRCVFCNVAENESILSIKPNIKSILAQAFYRIKYSNFSSGVVNITISGGEPSLFQVETLFVLKFFKTYFSKRSIDIFFEMQSNASNIDPSFAERLKQYGVGDVMISNHTHDEKEYQEYIGVSYKNVGPKVHQGILNLLDAGMTVSFNSILSNINKDSYLEHIKYLVKQYPKVLVFNIGFVQPHGMAQENFDPLFVQYSEISRVYNDVIQYLKGKNKKVHSHLVGLPLCFLDDWSSSMEYYHNKNLFVEGPSSHTLIQSINDDNKGYDLKCNNCMVKHLCSGIWKEYIGKQEIKPLRYYQYFELINNIDAVEYKGGGNSIAQLKSTGAKQILINTTGLVGSVNDIVSECKNKGFQMISIFFDDFTGVEGSFDQYASINIQIGSFRKEDVAILDSIIGYNESVGIQFQIRVDIHPRMLEDDYEDIVILYGKRGIRFHITNPDHNNILTGDNIFTYYK